MVQVGNDPFLSLLQNIGLIAKSGSEGDPANFFKTSYNPNSGIGIKEDTLTKSGVDHDISINPATPASFTIGVGKTSLTKLFQAKGSDVRTLVAALKESDPKYIKDTFDITFWSTAPFIVQMFTAIVKDNGTITETAGTGFNPRTDIDNATGADDKIVTSFPVAVGKWFMDNGTPRWSTFIQVDTTKVIQEYANYYSKKELESETASAADLFVGLYIGAPASSVIYYQCTQALGYRSKPRTTLPF